mgnify:CR=1 FL=1
MKNGNQSFVVLQSEWKQEMLRLDFIDRISVDTNVTPENTITCVDVLINDDHWESFDGQNLSVGLREVLHREILKAINIKLQMGSNNIDLETLIDECIEKLKQQ